jgi:hypothetical protein
VSQYSIICSHFIFLRGEFVHCSTFWNQKLDSNEELASVFNITHSLYYFLRCNNLIEGTAGNRQLLSLSLPTLNARFIFSDANFFSLRLSQSKQRQIVPEGFSTPYASCASKECIEDVIRTKTWWQSQCRVF